MNPPRTRYARSGDLHIAYQTVGEGPPDIVFVAPYVTHVEAMWSVSSLSRYLRKLADIGRLVLFDAVGSGLSDPLPEGDESLDSWTEDLRVVMDAVGLERAALHCFDSSGAMAMQFAATFPERVSALVLVNTFARVVRADDYSAGMPDRIRDRFVAWWHPQWGTGSLLHWLSPSRRFSPEEIEQQATYERQVASPGAALRHMNMLLDMDVRNALPSIQAPTLVIHRRDNQVIRVGHGRYLADHIPGARLVELPGDEHPPYHGDSDAVLAEIRQFLTGIREAPRIDRVLATILFTDVVGSTRLATEMGDEGWRELLDQHDEMVRHAISRFNGTLVKSTGDGALATFDGPARTIESARAILAAANGLGLTLRAGLHTGECEVRGEDIGGIAVHIASRIARHAAPGQVLVSRTVKDLVAGSGIEFSDEGLGRLEGILDEWHLFAVSPSSG